MTSHRLTQTVLLTLTPAACADADFDPYNLVSGLRVLAVQSEPPALAPGQTAVLAALVSAPAGETVSYHWSWCPFAQPRETGYACAITQEELQAIIDESLPDAAVTAPSFDLGSDDSVLFDAGGDATLVQALCRGLVEAGASSTSVVPDCSTRLEVTVRLEVATATESVTAIKRVPFVFDADDATNTNPALGNVRVAGDSEEESVAVEVAVDGSTELAAETTHRLWVDVPPATFETFTPAPDALTPDPEPRGEDLAVTWLVTAGETDAKRTTYIDGEVSVETLRENTWTLPALRDAGDRATLFLVIRDERGGVGWTARDLQITEP
jgi:hypothetical protein